MKTNSLFKIVLLFFLILLFSCEQEDVLQLEEAKVEEVIEEQEPAGELDYVTEASIPEIIEEISIRAVNGEAKKFAGKIRYNDVNIDLTSIIRVRKNGVVNYTFALDVKNASEYDIYNLVIGRDSKGRKKQPFIIGYEMEPQDMKAFFDSGEDFSKFKTNYRYYTFASFFADSKSGKVGKNGDCGGGATGGGTNGGAETNPGSTFTIGRGRQTVSSTFSNTRVGIPYGYSIRINDGTPAQASTTAISSGIQITTPQVPNAPVYSYRVPSGTTSVNASATGNGGSGSCLTVTFGLDGQINISSDCSNDKVKKSLTAKGDCPDGDGAIGINTASKPVQKIYYYLDNSLSKGEIEWLNDSKNYSTAVNIMNYLKNNRTNLTKAFAKWDIKLLSEGQIHDYEKSLKVMADGLRKFHGKEGIMLADYIDSILSGIGEIPRNDVVRFHGFVKEIVKEANYNMRMRIMNAYYEGLIVPVINYALFQVGGTMAVRLLQKIPVAWVIRGLNLNRMVQGAVKLGLRGRQANVQIIATSSPLTRARGLFNSMTKHAVSKKTHSNGTIVANMGNNNYITFRTVSQSGFEATIDFNFKVLLGNTPKVLKFKGL